MTLLTTLFSPVSKFYGLQFSDNSNIKAFKIRDSLTAVTYRFQTVKSVE